MGAPVGVPFFVYSNGAAGTTLTFGLSLASVEEPCAARAAAGEALSASAG
jgi:hypothetical protein